MKPASDGSSRFTNSPALNALVASGSRRVLSHAVETFDLKQPERFLRAETVHAVIQTECQALLEESIVQPHLTASITALIDLEKLTASAFEYATANLLQCGSDRRTLIFVPKENSHREIADNLRSARPLAAVVPATVEDVLLVSEEAGISPRSIALALERVYPGITEAAGRLHTRIDVEWLSLI